MFRTFILSTLLAIPFFSSTVANAQTKSYAVKIVPNQYADILSPDGLVILRYMHEFDSSNPERRFDTAKVYAHVMGTDGKLTLTKGPGGKFPHHRGIFIGWNRIQDGKDSHDLWHVRNTSQRHTDFVTTRANENGASIVSAITWVGSDGQPLIEEKRTYSVMAGAGCHALVDFVSELTSLREHLKLGGDPEHAGVQFRPSQSVAENGSATYQFHQEDIDPRKNSDLPWVAATFRIEDAHWTVQHMSHPKNPSGAVWSAYRDYGRFGPFAVIELEKGETATLRYRFRVTEGEAPSRETMQEQHRSYVNNQS